MKFKSLIPYCYFMLLFFTGITIADEYPEGSPVAINGRMHVDGVHMCNQYGKPTQLRGVSTHGIHWFPQCTKPAALDWLADDWHADIVRLAMYIDQSEGGWETDPVNFSALMHTTIEEVGKRGMYCLIDAHIINPGDPYLYLESSLAFFDSMASKWGNKEHVIWEICNEPNGPNANWARIREYADPVIAKIREFDSANVIVVGTPGWSTLGDGAWTEIRDNQIDDINIMYTYHFYAATHGDGHRSTFTAASEFLPLFVTEFGIQEASGCGAITVEGTRAWWDLCYEKKVSWCNWSFSDFGDFDPSYPVSSAIMVQNACYGDQFDSTMLKPIGEKLVYHEVQKADNFEVGTEIVSRPSKKLQGTSKKITVENTGEAFVITGPDASTAVLRDLSGRTIATIKPQESGRFVLKRAGVSSGIGVISIENGSSVLTQKVILR